jgi:hypothetical protein
MCFPTCSLYQNPLPFADRRWLRSYAFHLYNATQALRQEPCGSWAGYHGPWIENFWIQAFAPAAALADPANAFRPRQPTNPLPATQGKRGHDEQDATMKETEKSFYESLRYRRVSKRVAAGLEPEGPLDGMFGPETKQWPPAYMAPRPEYRWENATHAAVMEPFDFELFYPFVPLFVQWEDPLLK